VRKDKRYQAVPSLDARGAIISSNLLNNEFVLPWLSAAGQLQVNFAQCLAIDEFNYCRNSGSRSTNILADAVDDIAIYSGLPLKQFQRFAETQSAARNIDKSELPSLSHLQLSNIFGEVNTDEISLVEKKEGLFLESRLDDEKHVYLYAKKLLETSLLSSKGVGETHLFLESSLGANLQAVFFYLDKNGKRLSHEMLPANRNGSIKIPEETVSVMLGLRVYGPGASIIRALYLQQVPSAPIAPVTNSDTLLLTNNYPTYDDLYKNAFVHRRLVGYKAANRLVDVFCFDPNVESAFYYEFDGINVMKGSVSALESALESGRYTKLLVHFLSKEQWKLIEQYADKLDIFIWLHGADIQQFKHREFAYKEGFNLKKIKNEAKGREFFWSDFLRSKPPSTQLIFVSAYLAEQSISDYGVALHEGSFSVIPNPIDTRLFRYEKKGVEFRKKFLSIRPFASKIYANDITVKVIQELQAEKWFGECEFRIIGDGKLFEEVLEPIRHFSNVVIERKYLTQVEIADLHREYGVFLCPSRMDTHGVSRDEAMASGLVPVTNEVAAIPEFVDDSCAILAPAEDINSMVSGIKRLVENPDLYQQLSQAAAALIHERRSTKKIVAEELSLIAP